MVGVLYSGMYERTLLSCELKELIGRFTRGDSGIG